MRWFIIIWSAISLIVGIIGIKWHNELDDILEHDYTRNVGYGDYLLSGYLAYLLTPASIFGILAGVWLVICG